MNLATNCLTGDHHGSVAQSMDDTRGVRKVRTILDATSISIFEKVVYDAIHSQKASLFWGLWLVAFCAIADSMSKPGPWEQRKEREGITVHQREVPGWGIKEVRATGIVATSMQDLLQVITSVKCFGKINEIVLDAGVVQQNDQEKNYYFVVLDLPWPTTDRSAIYSQQVNVNNDKQHITITDIANSELGITPEMKDTVRIVRSTQEWKLQKIDDGTTKVSLSSLTDPNGPIPAFLINSMSVDAPMKSIANLRQLTRSGEDDCTFR